MKKIILLIAAALAWHHYYYIEDAPKHGPGVTAANAPYQEIISSEKIDFEGVTLTPKASFTVIAKALSVERYYFDREAELSPVDIVFGWEEMSDESITELVDISQSKRGYKWTSNTPLIKDNEITLKTANIHLIPANNNIATQVKQIRNGDLLYLEGYLVNVKNSSGWKWKTSLQREDIGRKSSEIFYVKELEILEPNQ